MEKIVKFVFFLGRIFFVCLGLSCIVFPSFISGVLLDYWGRVAEAAALDLLYIPNLGLLAINVVAAIIMSLLAVVTLIYAFYFTGSVIWACYTRKWPLWKDIWYHNK